MTATTDPRSARAERALRRLPAALRILGATWGGFFVVLMISPLLGIADQGDLYARATIWGHGYDENIQMICVMNIVLGWFLMRSARDPGSNRSFIDFALAVNAAHQGFMLVLGFVHLDMPIHLLTDIPAGVGHTILLALAWLPARGALSTSTRIDAPRPASIH